VNTGTGYSTTDVVSYNSKQVVLKNIQDWVETTSEGQRYQIKSSTPVSTSISPDLILQRGKGFLTAPIFIEFTIREVANMTKIHVVCYIKTNLFPFIKSSIMELPIKSGIIARIPRRNAANDLGKILAYLAITEFQLAHSSPKARTIWARILVYFLGYHFVGAIILLPYVFGLIALITGYPEFAYGFFIVGFLVGVLFIWQLITITRKTFG